MKPYYELYSTKIVVKYVAEFLVDIHKPGKVTKVTSNIGHISVRRVPLTTKSRLTFTTATSKEGFLSIYLYILDEEKSYITVTGTIHGLNFCSQGPLLELNPLNLDISNMYSHLKSKVKVWSKLYEMQATVALIDSLNKIMGETFKLFLSH